MKFNKIANLLKEAFSAEAATDAALSRIVALHQPKPPQMPRLPPSRAAMHRPNITVIDDVGDKPVKTELPNYYRWIIDECKRTSKPRTILT